VGDCQPQILYVSKAIFSQEKIFFQQAILGEKAAGKIAFVVSRLATDATGNKNV